jgi:hypothetical protein
VVAGLTIKDKYVHDREGGPKEPKIINKLSPKAAVSLGGNMVK